jgi:hypothetical protein
MQDFDPGTDRCPPGRCGFGDLATDFSDMVIFTRGIRRDPEPPNVRGFRGGVVVGPNHDLAPEGRQRREAIQRVACSE